MKSEHIEVVNMSRASDTDKQMIQNAKNTSQI